MPSRLAVTASAISNSVRSITSVTMYTSLYPHRQTGACLIREEVDRKPDHAPSRQKVTKGPGRASVARLPMGINKSKNGNKICYAGKDLLLLLVPLCVPLFFSGRQVDTVPGEVLGQLFVRFPDDVQHGVHLVHLPRSLARKAIADAHGVHVHLPSEVLLVHVELLHFCAEACVLSHVLSPYMAFASLKASNSFGAWMAKKSTISSFCAHAEFSARPLSKRNAWMISCRFTLFDRTGRFALLSASRMCLLYDSTNICFVVSSQRPSHPTSRGHSSSLPTVIWYSVPSTWTFMVTLMLPPASLCPCRHTRKQNLPHIPLPDLLPLC
nr:MAG TPA: hypothetical protein [Caudoviricetes sp.]